MNEQTQPIIMIGRGIVFFAFSILWWGFVFSRYEKLVRKRLGKLLGVKIEYGKKGRWKVVSDRPWYRTLWIELLYLPYAMVAFTVWAAALALVLMILSWLQGGEFGQL